MPFTINVSGLFAKRLFPQPTGSVPKFNLSAKAKRLNDKNLGEMQSLSILGLFSVLLGKLMTAWKVAWQ